MAPILILALLCLALFASGCSLNNSTAKTAGHGSKVSGTAISKTALSTVGTPYVWGGSSPRGFDCSGLVAWSYARHGVQVPRTAKEQSKLGASVPRNALRPGDVVVFRISSGLHTGIYTGRGRFVHSPSTGKRVRVDNMSNGYWRGKFVAARRHHRVR